MVPSPGPVDIYIRGYVVSNIYAFPLRARAGNRKEGRKSFLPAQIGSQHVADDPAMTSTLSTCTWAPL